MLFGQLRLASKRPVKRIVKSQNGWGIETEQLEDRALLSATGRCAAMADSGVVADVARSHSKAMEVPNVGGLWSVSVASGELPFSNNVNFIQNGKVVTGSYSSQGATVDITAKLKGPGLTQAKVAATVHFSGQTFNLKGIQVTYSNNFTQFDGSKSFPSIGLVTVHGTRVVT